MTGLNKFKEAIKRIEDRREAEARERDKRTTLAFEKWPRGTGYFIEGPMVVTLNEGNSYFISLIHISHSNLNKHSTSLKPIWKWTWTPASAPSERKYFKTYEEASAYLLLNGGNLPTKEDHHE